MAPQHAPHQAARRCSKSSTMPTAITRTPRDARSTPARRPGSHTCRRILSLTRFIRNRAAVRALPRLGRTDSHTSGTPPSQSRRPAARPASVASNRPTTSAGTHARTRGWPCRLLRVAHIPARRVLARSPRGPDKNEDSRRHGQNAGEPPAPPAAEPQRHRADEANGWCAPQK